MNRNMIGASSALAILALFAGAPATGLAHDGEKLCNVILDGDGEPVRESDSDNIAHSNSTECADDADADAAAIETTDTEQKTVVVTEPPEPVAVVEPLVVYFDVGQDSLDAGARAEVDAYVAALMATSPTSLDVIGYTDTSGPAALNARLSEARANSVAAALVDAGVPPGTITRGASGEDSLAIDTPDDTREASNRRVTVTPAY